MDQIIQTGRTVEEAEEQALAALGADRNEVEVEILSRGRQGFLGIGGELAEVRVTRLSPTGAPEDEPVDDLDDQGAEDDQPTVDSPAAAPVIPGTPAEAVDPLLPDLDLILVMTVNPGFGGQRFIEGTLEKLSAARQLIDASGESIRLEVDGGVKVDNIGRIARSGADTFVAGSAIFGSGNYAATISRMRREIAAVR